jgi:hypothetical protein
MESVFIGIFMFYAMFSIAFAVDNTLEKEKKYPILSGFCWPIFILIRTGKEIVDLTKSIIGR